MTYRLDFMAEAIDELIGINQWVAEYAGQMVANHKIAEIETAIVRLQDRPHHGNLQLDLGIGIRAIPVGEKAVVTFWVDDNDQSFLILSVTYGGQDWQSCTRKRL